MHIYYIVTANKSVWPFFFTKLNQGWTQILAKGKQTFTFQKYNMVSDYSEGVLSFMDIGQTDKEYCV